MEMEKVRDLLPPFCIARPPEYLEGSFALEITNDRQKISLLARPVPFAGKKPEEHFNKAVEILGVPSTRPYGARAVQDEDRGLLGRPKLLIRP